MLSTLNSISILHCSVAFGLLQHSEDAKEDIDLWQVKKKEQKQYPHPQTNKKTCKPKTKT